MKFDKKAWDKIYKKQGRYFDNSHRDIPKLVNILKKDNAKRILDLGCGTGRHVIHFAKEGFEVYGTDISETALTMTGKWLLSENLSAELMIHDLARKLPFADSFFEAVISIQVIHHARIGTIRKVIREIERVLKPRGLIFVTVPIYKGPITDIKKDLGL